jgi:glycosyltransferase involved in cell wall biosynthesis
MRLLFIADGRSPIARNWIEHFTRAGHEVHLVSTFDCKSDFPLASLNIVPAAFSGLKKQPAVRAVSSLASRSRASIWGAASVGLRAAVRHWLGTFTLPNAGKQVQAIAKSIQPELVHAMRIPYEGMMASYAQLDAPLVMSVWGNDFTLHARSNPLMASATRRALRAADALHSDCHRDQRLARQMGFYPEKPWIVLPTGGGVQTDTFYPPETYPSSLVIINPRGFRAYVRNDTFFRSIPLVLAKYPQARFVCPAMQAERQAYRWVEELGIQKAVELMPSMPREQMAVAYREAQVLVSVTTHDGTPNTLLEGMACGCFPICGDLESIREWIVSGENGLLVDPYDSQSLAGAVIQAIGGVEARDRAREINLRLIEEKAEHGMVMREAERFYRAII